MAELEARKLKYPNNGTETLLMGILVEGKSQLVNSYLIVLVHSLSLYLLKIISF